ncbi:MAG: TIGR02757 family protein [Bacteroidota bacterium]
MKKPSFDLADFLNTQYRIYNQPGFIQDDPICIPHLFSQKQDIEIMGFFASIFAWGQRPTIINKCKNLIERFDNAPYDFIRNHHERDLKKLLAFKHRTFNDTDLLYFVSFLQYWYKQHESLESAFTSKLKAKDPSIENGLNGFRELFFSMEDVPHRTLKHVSSPLQQSACKRINMYLRWMVRSDKTGVDFGIWKTIKPAQLICPLDLHVQRVAAKLGLLHRTQSDWKAAIELTENLRKFDPTDPVKYDFALFGLGVTDKF